jgi:hypothetical protein
MRNIVGTFPDGYRGGALGINEMGWRVDTAMASSAAGTRATRRENFRCIGRPMSFLACGRSA